MIQIPPNRMPELPTRGSIIKPAEVVLGDTWTRLELACQHLMGNSLPLVASSQALARFITTTRDFDVDIPISLYSGGLRVVLFVTYIGDGNGDTGSLFLSSTNCPSGALIVVSAGKGDLYEHIADLPFSGVYEGSKAPQFETLNISGTADSDQFFVVSYAVFQLPSPSMEI